MIQSIMDSLFSLTAPHMALDLFMGSVMFFVVWRIRRDSWHQINEAFRDEHTAWRLYRDVRVQNQRLREENKMLRHQLEARF